jgi:hypothetical protein
MNKAILFMILVTTSITGIAQQRAIFTMDNIWCNKTTEAGEDEVYLLVNYQYRDGRNGTYRIPNRSHWDLNDDNNPRQVSRVDLFSDFLNFGESVDLNVFIMEEDCGGNNGQGNIIVSPQILNQGSDDYIGSFSVKITNYYGNYYVNYNNFVGCSNFGQWPNYFPNFSNRTFGAFFVGGGSNYNCRFILHF